MPLSKSEQTEFLNNKTLPQNNLAKGTKSASEDGLLIPFPNVVYFNLCSVDLFSTSHLHSPP